jgi:membrane protein implicated in regulation of membrane protease activity
MRGDLFWWAALALLLCAAEMIAPGAFMLWLGLAAAAVFVIVWLVPGLSVLAQAVLFVVLGVVSILAYRRWFRGRGRASDKPALNRRTAALIGRVVPLQTAIVDGRGRVQIADAFWDVEGPDLPAGTHVRVLAADGMVLKVAAVG